MLFSHIMIRMHVCTAGTECESGRGDVITAGTNIFTESKDYDEFAGNTQAENNDHILKCAFFVAVGAGLIKFRKPLMNAGKLLMQRL